MARRCLVCMKDVEPKAGPGTAQLCPDCLAVFPAEPGSPGAPVPTGSIPPLRARGAEFRNRHSVGVGDVLSKSMGVLAANLFPILAVTFVVLSPEILYTVVHAMTPKEQLTVKATSTFSMIQMAMGLLLGPLVSAAIISGVFQYLRGSQVTLGSIFASGIARVFPALWTGLLAGVLSLLPMAPGVLLVIGGGFKGSTAFVALGGVLLMVGAILSMLVSMAIYVAVPVSVVEKCNGFPAIKRSLTLTKNNRGQIFVLLLAVGFFAVLLGFVVKWTGDYRTVVLVNLVVKVVLSAFSGVLAGVVYYNLRAVKEGIGIEELAGAFD